MQWIKVDFTQFVGKGWKLSCCLMKELELYQGKGQLALRRFE